MKILFIGTVEFSYRILEKLIKLNAEIVGVCTKDGSNFNNDFISEWDQVHVNLTVIPWLVMVPFALFAS